MLDLKKRADLQRLVDEGLEESLTLDYKASPSLSRDGKNPEELCKDVSALANSAGGQLIYGIEEDKTAGKPSKVDDGVIDPKITKEWIEQILNSKVQPRMDGVRIDRVDMETGKFGYVITVQQSQIGPHQAPDGKYYKRFNFQSVRCTITKSATSCAAQRRRTFTSSSHFQPERNSPSNIVPTKNCRRHSF